MAYLPGLLLALAVFWFALSGETSPLFLFLGAISVLLALWLAARLKIIDRDASPYYRIPQMLTYGGWLMVEIVKSNIAVIRKILGPSHAIDPVVVNVETTATTNLGKAMFANSITLTPGTVTVDVDGDQLVVHALVRETSPASSFADMDRKVVAAADGKGR
ncbi:MAG TPA: Na+/H+ antiporter subunit E [Hyphomonadaceae bacterium]|jgi:multicomponent Na+:H+ antiporter subunit E|nr:Na+/H+ antiporter subunit E [Hyphomonadaceae bacterium]HPN05445.1 Na+/H+ antiporter subunit E [Hyphomonadaceae bacterium]